MPNYANITVVGHLGRDPETRNVGDHSVTNFSIAVTEKRRNKEPLTTWYDISAWNKVGEFVQNYMKKGSAVLVSGTPYAESYSAKDGTPKTKFCVRADRVIGVGSRQAADGSEEPAGDDVPPAAKNLDDVKAKLKEMQAKVDGKQTDPNDPPF